MLLQRVSKAGLVQQLMAVLGGSRFGCLAALVGLFGLVNLAGLFGLVGFKWF